MWGGSKLWQVYKELLYKEKGEGLDKETWDIGNQNTGAFASKAPYERKVRFIFLIP